VKRAYVAILALALVAQTSSANIDLAPIVNILYAILPLLLTIMVIAIVFKFIGKFIGELGRTFEFVKPAIPLMLLAQTTTDSATVDLTPVVNILYAILPLLFTIMIIMIVFKLFGSLFEAVGRSIKAVKVSAAKLAIPVALLAQTSSGSVDLAQQITSQLTPILFTLITIILIIALPLLIFKVLAKSVIDVIRG
jgi:hypothetical protein